MTNCKRVFSEKGDVWSSTEGGRAVTQFDAKRTERKERESCRGSCYDCKYLGGAYDFFPPSYVSEHVCVEGWGE